MAWLADIEGRILAVCRDLASGQWAQLTRGDDGLLQAAEPAWRALYGDPELEATVLKLTARGFGGALGRRIDVLRREVLGEAARGEATLRDAEALASALSTAEVRLDGRSVSDRELSRRLADPARREAAWRARAAVGQPFVPRWLALRDARNRVARRRGFESYWELGLEVISETSAELERILNALEEVLPRPAARWPWEQEAAAPEPAVDVSSAVLADLERRGMTLAGVRLDLDEHPGKSGHAYCIAVSPPEDIRVVASLTPDVEGARTLLHELGHAAHSSFVKGDYLLLRDAPSPAFHEAIAEIFASLWPATPKRREEALRWAALWTRFEQQLYCEPGADPTARFEALAGRWLGWRPTGIPAWARLPQFASHPVYQPTYVVATLVASQVLEALGPLDAAGMERLVREVIQPGARETRDQMLQRVTGRALSPREAAARHLSG